MTREELSKLIASSETAVIAYQTQRDFYNWLLNRALEDDHSLLSALEGGRGKNEPKTFVIVVQTLRPNSSRVGQSI